MVRWRSVSLLLGFALLVGGVVSGIAVAARDRAAVVVVVKEAFNKKLQKTIFVTGGGMTLYENTSEQKGKIHCIGSCRAFWPPLLVPAGGKLSAGAGVSQSKLGTLKRPDGGRQVTYRGVPLYRFVSDKKAGEVRGQGVKDLGGTWFAASQTSGTATASSPPTTTAPATTTSGGYSY